MTGLTQGAVTSIDTRGVLGYSEGTWANDLRSAPPTTLPDAFTVSGTPSSLIWDMQLIERYDDADRPSSVNLVLPR